MKKEPADLKLKERVRELKCLYALSKIIWEEKNDLDTIFLKTLAILPQAMQYPALAEVSILVNKKAYETSQFAKGISFISSPLRVGKKKYGTIRWRTKLDHRQQQRLHFYQRKKNCLMWWPVGCRSISSGHPLKMIK